MLKKLKLVRNIVIHLLSFPFYLIFKYLPFLLERLIFHYFKDKKLVFTKQTQPKYIFLINSKSGKNMGRVVKDILSEYYKARYLCDIIKADPKQFILDALKVIREDDKVS